MRNRLGYWKIVLLVLFILSLTPFSLYSMGEYEITEPRANEIQSIAIPSDDSSLLNMSWTSRTESIPQPISNNSELIGDHVVLNATWDQQIAGGNVTDTRIRITDGYTYSTTRSLVSASSGSGLFEFDYEVFDWIEFSGLSRGDNITIIGYAGSDVDFVMYPGNIPFEEYDFGMDLLEGQMSTSSHFERGTLFWAEDYHNMFLGCFNYEDVEGNYTISVEIGEFYEISESGNAASGDTYYLDNVNDTYEITIIAKTDLNESFSVRYENISICNFFFPQFTSLHVYQLPYDELVYNISWTTADTNTDDSHYFEFWLSNNEGYTFMRLETNITNQWYVWNSTGWIQDIYMARVRAFSVDLSSEDCGLDNPPDSYWPGDFADILVPNIYGGDIHSYPTGYFTLEVSAELDHPYYFGSLGNVINIELTFSHSIPDSIYCYLINNGTGWFHEQISPTSHNEFVTVNIDGLGIGYHIVQVRFYDYNTQPIDQILTFNVTDITTLSNGSTSGTLNLLQPLLIGISVGSATIIGVVTILTIRLKRNPIVEIRESN